MTSFSGWKGNQRAILPSLSTNIFSGNFQPALMAGLPVKTPRIRIQGRPLTKCDAYNQDSKIGCKKGFFAYLIRR